MLGKSATGADVAVYAIDKLITEARRLASEYRKTTGKPLGGVSGQIAEYDASRLLDLQICEPRAAGYDAVGRGSRQGKRIQIKGRAIFDEGKSGQRIGQLRTEQAWDSVVLVLMDDNHEPYEIYEVDRDDVVKAMDSSQSSNRSKRGALSVAKFKNIARLVWTRENGLEEAAWDNQANAT